MRKANLKTLFAISIICIISAVFNNAHADVPVELVGQWGGLCKAVAVSGNILYMGLGPSLIVLDITSPSNPIQLGQVTLQDCLWDIAIMGHYAYVADRNAGLAIIDISDPYTPTLVGSFDTDGWASGIAVAGSFAYVADGYAAGLAIIDISNPVTPNLVGRYDTLGYADDVAVVGSYAYVCSGYAGLEIIDISNPAEPNRVSGCDTRGHPWGVAIAGNYAYVADGDAGLAIIDISNPKEPMFVRRYYTAGHVEGLVVADSYAYLADGHEGLTIIDISNPRTPTFVGSCDVIGWAWGVAVEGNYAYVTDEYRGLVVMDISNHATPVPVKNLDTCKSAIGVAIAGKYAYIANGWDGFAVIDISNSRTPTLVGSYHYYIGQSGDASNVALAGNYAYVADEVGLTIFDISNPASPNFVGRFETYQFGFTWDVAVVGNYAYVTTGTYEDEGSLVIIDISNACAPTLVGSYDVNGRAGCIAVEGRYAYVTSSKGGLEIVNVSNPAAPTLVGSHSTSGAAFALAVAGKYAYVADWGGDIAIMDISNPAEPALVGSYDPGASARISGMVIKGHYLYVADGDGIAIIDVSDPSAPILVGRYDINTYSTNFAFDVAIVGGYAYVADDEGGLVILRVGTSGGVVVYPSQSYSASTKVLSLSAMVTDTLYGPVTSGTFTWSLKNSEGGERESGSLEYNSSIGRWGRWVASPTLFLRLPPDNYTVEYSIVTNRQRTASAIGYLTIPGAYSTIRGYIMNALDKTPIEGATVHLYDADAIWKMAWDHFNRSIPSLSEILTYISPIREATTDSKGVFEWLDISPGPSYVVYATKEGYLPQYTESFPYKATDYIITKNLYLSDAVNTLAAMLGDTEKVLDACSDILDRNSEIMAHVANRSYDDLWVNDAIVEGLNMAASIAGVISLGKNGYNAWTSLDKIEGLKIASLAGADMVPFESRIMGEFVGDSIFLWAKFGVGELTQAMKEKAANEFKELVTNRNFPRTKEGCKQLDAYTLYANALEDKLAMFKAEAGTIPLQGGFSIGAARTIADDYRNRFVFSKDGNLLILFPARATLGAMNLTLGKSELAYNQISDVFRTLNATEGVLSVVSIIGSGCTFFPVAQGAGIALGAGAAIGKALVVEAKVRALDTMVIAFATTFANYRLDNASATMAFTSFVDLLRAEAASPYYLRDGSQFTTSAEVNIGPHVHVHMQIPRPFQDPLVVDEDVVCALPSWWVSGPVFRTADIKVTNTGNAPSEIRALGYVTWSLVPGIATPIGSLALGSQSLLTGLSTEGPKWVEPGEQASFNIPYIGFSSVFATVPKPHYFCAQDWSGPWAQQLFTKRFWVLSGFPYDPLFWLSVQGELGTQYASEGDYVYAAVDESGNLGISKVAEYMASASGPDNFVLNSNTPQVETAFVVEGNDVYAVDLKLFAPQDSAVAILVTDTMGRRLGYSASDGITCSELIGSVTNMAQRPILIHLLEPPKDETYTVRISLLSPGPHDVPVSLFYESVKRSGALMTALPSPVIIDSHKATTQTVFVRLAEISGQEALTGVNAALDTLEMWGGGAALPLPSDVNQVIGDIPAGEQRYVAWHVNYPRGIELGKYVGAATISSNETADLIIPVVALVRHATETVSSYEGPDPNIATIQKSLTLGPDGSAQTWVHIPRGYHVVHAALGVVAASPNLENPLIDIGADGSIEWDFSGKLDLGLVVSNVEDAFNKYLSEHTPDANGLNVPIRVIANAGETILLNGIQLYLDSIPGDSEPDGDVDWADLGKFTSRWLDTDCNDPNWCDRCDIDKSSFVDFADFTQSAEHWLEGISH